MAPVGSSQRRWHRAAESALLFVLLLVLWVVLSGRIAPLPLLLGVLSAALVTALTRDRPFWLGGGERGFGMPLASVSLPQLVLYPFRLLGAIARANVQVAAIVLDPRLPIDPAFMQFRTGLRRPFSQAFLANVITVTPGTVTVDLQDGRFLVHALQTRLASDLVDGRLADTIARVLGEPRQGAPEDLRWVRSLEDLP